VEGPHFVTPSPHRTPVLFHAGASPVGQRFAARNVEGVFISSPDQESARGLIDETPELAAGYGRDPYDVKFFQGLSLIVGRTTEEAREKEARMEELVSLDGVLCHILGDADIDAGALPLDTPLSDLGEFRGVQGWVRWAGEDAHRRAIHCPDRRDEMLHASKQHNSSRRTHTSWSCLWTCRDVPTRL